MDNVDIHILTDYIASELLKQGKNHEQIEDYLMQEVNRVLVERSYGGTKILVSPVSGMVHVGWQKRYLDADEGPSCWSYCDNKSAEILVGRNDYELRPLYAMSEDV